MKVSVRLIGDGFARADALVAEVRRRALERMQERFDARRGPRRAERVETRDIAAPNDTPSTR